MPERMVPPRFEPAVSAIRSLQRQPRYLGALIFGSVAEGASNHHSDLDVVVMVSEDNPCPNVNHPGYWGHKLDITFRSWPQVVDFAETWLHKGTREPTLASALILFDKTGQLQTLQRRMSMVHPAPATQHDRLDAAALVYHIDNKVRRNVCEDPDAALYCMHVGIGELLEQHFRLHGKWWVSSKKVLRALGQWDRPCADLVRKFMAAANLDVKLAAWSEIVEHVQAPLGGPRPIAENNCDCSICTRDLAALRQSLGGPAPSRLA